MQSPGQYRSRIFSLAAFSADEIEQIRNQLSRIDGVVEAVIVDEEKVAYLKLDRNNLDEPALNELLSGAGST